MTIREKVLAGLGGQCVLLSQCGTTWRLTISLNDGASTGDAYGPHADRSLALGRVSAHRRVVHPGQTPV